MNRVHRIVWSECRKAFIVAGEHAKAKGKPCSSTRKAVASAVVMALAALAAEPAMAAANSCTTGVNTFLATGAPLVTTPCKLTGTGASLVVDGGTYPGGLSVGGTTAVWAQNASVTSISNSGTIQSTNATTIRIQGSTVSGGITNNAGGTISTNNNPGTAIHLTASTVSSIINSGIISGTVGIKLEPSSTISGAATGILVQNGGKVTGGITSNGLISGTSHGINVVGSTSAISGGADGILLIAGGKVTGGINNSGTISGSGYGINVTTGSTVTGGISSSGLISGNTGIHLYNSTVTGGITSSGTISGGISSDATSTLPTITNLSGGTISGRLNILSSTAVSNAGTIALPTGNSTITGSYTQTSTVANTGLSIGVTGSGQSHNYGQLTVIGNANLSSTDLIYVNVGDPLDAYGASSSTSLFGQILFATHITGNPTFTVASNSTADIFHAFITYNFNGQGIDAVQLSYILAPVANSCSSGANTINAGSSITAKCTLGNGAGLVVNGASGGTIAGSIITAGTAVYASNSSPTSISNSGTISGALYGVNLNNSSVSSGITSSGLISGGTAGINVDGTSTISGAAAILIQNGGTVSGGITSSGLISGTVIGIRLNSNSTVDNINNTTTGTISGIIYGGNAGIFLSHGTVSGGVTNNAGGTISGGNNGIFLYSASTVTGGISNSGTISGSNYSGIRLYSSSAGNITNNVGGKISGVTGIFLSSHSTVGGITSSGLISGSTAGINVDATSTISGATGILISTGGSVSGGITSSGLISGNNGGNGGYGIKIQGAGSVDAITNNPGGTISGGSRGIYVSYGTISGAITNNGLIQGLAGNAIYIYSGSVGSINNTTSGKISGSSGIVLNMGTVSGGITNSGTISGVNSTGTYGEGIELYTNSTVSGGITNSGMISGKQHGISIIGNSSGALGSTVRGGIANSGTISGGTTGIRVISSSSVSGGITNSGTISGSSYAINVASGGTISGGITIAGNNTASFIGQVYAPGTPVTVAAGAAYTMNDGNLFTITGSTFTNNGNLGVAPSGTGTITGDYTQSAAGIFQANVIAQMEGISHYASAGKLLVNGTANLTSNAKIYVNVTNDTNLILNQIITGVITANTLHNSTFVVTDSSSKFDFLAYLDANNANMIDLKVIAQGGTSILTNVQIAGNHPDEGAARVLDDSTKFENSQKGQDLQTFIQNNLTNGTAQQISDNVKKTLPLMTTGLKQMGFMGLHSVDRIIQSHMEQNHGLSAGDDVSIDRQFWIKPVGSVANQGDLSGVSGYKANSYGVVLGADRIVTDKSRAGVAVSYTSSKVDSNSSVAPNSATLTAYRLVGYASYSLDEATDVNGQVDYGASNTKGNRTITGTGNALSDYNSWNAHVGVGAGRTMPFAAKTTLTPSVRLDYTYMQDSGYTETGVGGLGNIVSANSAKELVGYAEGKLTHDLAEPTSKLFANLGVGYDFLAKQSSVTSAFIGAPGAQYITNGLNVAPWMVRGGVGLMTNSKTMEITARYDVELREASANQTISVKFRKPF